jgi:hypothetical protein
VKREEPKPATHLIPCLGFEGQAARTREDVLLGAVRGLGYIVSTTGITAKPEPIAAARWRSAAM